MADARPSQMDQCREHLHIDVTWLKHPNIYSNTVIQEFLFLSKLLGNFEGNSLSNRPRVYPSLPAVLFLILQLAASVIWMIWMWVDGVKDEHDLVQSPHHVLTSLKPDTNRTHNIMASSQETHDQILCFQIQAHAFISLTIKRLIQFQCQFNSMICLQV